MIIYKIICHICSIIRIILYRIIYVGHISIPFTTSFRKGCTVLVSNRGKLIIGKDVFFNNYCSIICCDEIRIGNDTILGENVKIYDHNHRYQQANVPIKKQGFSYAPVCIGNNCWLANNVVVLKGVTIGNHCVIGAGCIVYKDVPDNTVLLANGSSWTMKS